MTVCEHVDDYRSVFAVLDVLGIDPEDIDDRPQQAPAPPATPRDRAEMPDRAREGLAWQEGAACLDVDPKVFFPGTGGSNRPAQEVCSTCAVLSRCRTFALSEPDLVGVWAGMTRDERASARRADRAA